MGRVYNLQARLIQPDLNEAEELIAIIGKSISTAQKNLALEEKQKRNPPRP